MRIALTHPYCFPYVRRGTERNIDGLARYLTRAGHEVVTISTSPDGYAEESGDGGRRILLEPRWHEWYGRLRIEPTHIFALTCPRAIKRWQPEVVHSFYFFDAIAAAMLARRHGFATVLQMNGAPIPEAYYRYLPPDRWLIRRAIEMNENRVVCSEFIRGMIAEHYGVDSEAIVPGINLDEFLPGDGAPVDEPIILAIGNFDMRHKGLNVLLAAFAQIRQQVPGARLRLSGALATDRRESLVASLPAEITRGIEFLGLGSPSGVPALYQQASLVVVPSVFEPSGTVMMESWASGTPVVASNHGGLPEFVDEKVAVLFEPGLKDGEAGNVDGLVAGILRGLSLARSDGIRRACREHAERFSWDVIGPRIEEVYARAVARA